MEPPLGTDVHGNVDRYSEGINTTATEYVLSELVDERRREPRTCCGCLLGRIARFDRSGQRVGRRRDGQDCAAHCDTCTHNRISMGARCVRRKRRAAAQRALPQKGAPSLAPVQVQVDAAADPRAASCRRRPRARATPRRRGRRDSTGPAWARVRAVCRRRWREEARCCPCMHLFAPPPLQPRLDTSPARLAAQQLLHPTAHRHSCAAAQRSVAEAVQAKTQARPG